MGQAFSLALGRCEAALTGILFIVYSCPAMCFQRDQFGMFSLSGPSTSRLRANTK